MNAKLVGAIAPVALASASCGTAMTGDNAAPASTSAKEAVATASEPFRSEVLATLEEPWAMAIVPGSSDVVITERAGTIKLVGANNAVWTVSGAPKVDYGGQGGLGDIAFGPDDGKDTAYPVYLSWAEAGDSDTRGAVVARGELVIDEMEGRAEIRDLQVIWRQTPKVTGRGHYSHRLAISPDGRSLFISSGDRQKMDPAQDPASDLGKIIRLPIDVAGNPAGAPERWSMGHRNVLGLAFDASGQLWDLEHGPAGGDEINLVRKGANYGWPVVSEGDHYDGRDIPPHASRPEFAAPAISWNPVIAPGDFTFYRGTRFKGWQGQAIVGGMKPTVLVRVAFDGARAREVERIPMERRIRDVAEAPDGSLLVLEDKAGGRLIRLTPR